jgi:hypothetical protein
MTMIALAVMIGFLRPWFLYHRPSDRIFAAYTAFAHIFVGVLLAAWYYTRDDVTMMLLVVLTFVEVVCFLGSSRKA